MYKIRAFLSILFLAICVVDIQPDLLSAVRTSNLRSRWSGGEVGRGKCKHFFLTWKKIAYLASYCIGKFFKGICRWVPIYSTNYRP